MLIKKLLMLMPLFLITGCATVAPHPQPVEAPASQQAQIQAQQAELPPMKKYKMKVVIGRFTNETNYGRALLSDEEYQHMGIQASDMLATRLIQSNRFIVLERPDLTQVQAEQQITNTKGGLIGADALVFGAVTEFGRSTTGKAGFLSSAITQTARSTVEIRLVDTKTGQAFFSTTGTGQASTEQGQTAGFGNAAAYDSTLNDRAIGASVSDLINNLITTLQNRPWKTDVLKVDGDQVYISGGKHQGIKEGDILFVMKRTGAVASKQSGFSIDLPPEKIATIKVTSLFGDSETDEGSQCQITDGKIDPSSIDQLFVKEGE